METRNNDVLEIKVKDIVSVLLHKIWLIMIFIILFAGIAALISRYLMTPVYTSTASVYVINREEDDRLTLNDLQTGTQLTKDYRIIVTSRPVTEKVIKDLKLKLTHEELSSMISVSTPEDTRVLEITVNYYDPEMAKKLADAIAEVSSERMVDVMEMEKVNILEAAHIPTAPSSPNTIKNIIIGGLSGAALAAIAAIVRYLTNDSIKTSEEIEKYLGITTLSSIPVDEDGYKKKNNKKKSEIKHSRRKSALAG